MRRSENTSAVLKYGKRMPGHTQITHVLVCMTAGLIPFYPEEDVGSAVRGVKGAGSAGLWEGLCVCCLAARVWGQDQSQ